MELKANEFRIGNLVECFGVREVIAIEKDKIKVQQEKSEGHFIIEYCPITSLSLKPIPLTEEWLLKFGFKEVYKNCFEIYSGLYLNIEKKCFDSESYFFPAYTEYVHELQNLHFALTNEELTIKM